MGLGGCTAFAQESGVGSDMEWLGAQLFPCPTAQDFSRVNRLMLKQPPSRCGSEEEVLRIPQSWVSEVSLNLVALLTASAPRGQETAELGLSCRHLGTTQ